jgi:hypothetical protein
MMGKGCSGSTYTQGNRCSGPETELTQTDVDAVVLVVVVFGYKIRYKKCMKKEKMSE